MFILKSTQQRCNPHKPYTDENGTRYSRMPKELYDEVSEPTPPEDYSSETYFRNELQSAPYVEYVKKPDEMIEEIRVSKLKQVRDNLIDTGGCYVASVDKWFHNDTKSKQQQLALALLGTNLPSGIQWKTMDGSFVTMTPELASEIVVAQISKENTIFSLTETKILDSTNIDTWPDNYVEAEEILA